MVTERESLHRLVDELPEEEIGLARRYLQALRRGAVYDLEAWIDDEPLTEEEREAVREAREDVEAGRVHTLDEVKRDLGL